MRILIASNNRDSRADLETRLSHYGLCVHAETGQHAVTLFLEAHEHLIPYDLVVLDTHLADLGGLKTLRRIRDWENQNLIAIHGQEAKVIVLTSINEDDDLFTSFRQGCEWYVTQPITQEALEESLSVVGINLSNKSSH